MSNHTNNRRSTFADYEWMMEEGADEKLQREVEEQLKLAELERLMMQEEKESGDLQMLDQMSRLSTEVRRPVFPTATVVKTQLNVNAPVFVPSWEKA